MRQNYHRELTPIAIQRIKEYQCPSCGKDKREWTRRTDWLCCSKECTEKYYKEHEKSYSWQEFRYQIFKRDDSTCKMCGKRFVKKGIKIEFVPDESQLIADHIIPIELGGSMWYKENIQTLCIKCNKIKTKKDAGNIAVHRRRIKKKLNEMNTVWFPKHTKPIFMNVSYLETLIL